MKYFGLILLVVLALGCEKKSLHEQVKEDLSNVTVQTNDPKRGTDPAKARLDIEEGRRSGSNPSNKTDGAGAPKP